MRTSLHRHAPRHFRHRCQQRKAAGVGGDGFISDAHRAARDEVLGLLRIGRQVQVSEQDLPRTQALAFLRLGFLHLHDHVRDGKDFIGACGDRRADLPIGCIVETDALPRVAFHDDIVALRDEFLYGGRREADAVFQHFDFLRHADTHGRFSSPKTMG
jgi:hypothetical protein